MIKVGDTVIVKTVKEMLDTRWSECCRGALENPDSRVLFTKEMEGLCGLETKVSKMQMYSDGFEIEGGDDYIFTKEMVKPPPRSIPAHEHSVDGAVRDRLISGPAKMPYSLDSYAFKLHNISLCSIDAEDVRLFADYIYGINSTLSSDIKSGPIQIKTLKHKGENNMYQRINADALLKMAQPSLVKELEAAGAAGLPQGIMDALNKQMAKEAEEAAGQAASEILKLVKLHDINIAEKVNELRRIRAAEKKLLEQMEALNKSKQYGMDSGNFLPLCKELGCISIGFTIEDRTILSVPADYKPEVKKAKK